MNYDRLLRIGIWVTLIRLLKVGIRVTLIRLLMLERFLLVDGWISLLIRLLHDRSIVWLSKAIGFLIGVCRDDDGISVSRVSIHWVVHFGLFFSPTVNCDYKDDKEKHSSCYASCNRSYICDGTSGTMVVIIIAVPAWICVVVAIWVRTVTRLHRTKSSQGTTP